MFLFATGLVWGRCVLSDSRHAEALSAAAQALDDALRGQEGGWERAEGAYGRAARASLLDAFPLWVVEVIGAWRRGESASTEAETALLLTQIRERDYRGALSAARALEASKRRDYIVRLATDLLALQTSDLR